MILVAATVAAADAFASTPGLTPSSNVTDFLCSDPCLPIEVDPVAAAKVDVPKIGIISSSN
jgi:hypothetical protein